MARGKHNSLTKKRKAKSPALDLFYERCNRGTGQTAVQAHELLNSLSDDVKKALDIGGHHMMAQLADAAAGTVFHSHRVAELMLPFFPEAECQAAIYLHDIGKIVYPNQFAENVVGESRRPEPYVLVSHVDAGMILAEYYVLSTTARNAIREHHGSLPVGPDEHYHGREPRSLFTATLMMADTMEALQAQGKLNKKLIWSLYEYRQRKGQFNFVDEPNLRATTKQLIKLNTPAA